MLRTVTRFAGPALKTLYPGFAAGPRIMSRASWSKAAPEIAMDMVPNLFFSGLTAASLPGADPASGFDGANFGERATAGGFDFLTSTLASSLGRLGGRGLSRMTGRIPGGEGDALMTNIGGMGAEGLLWGSGLVTNPGVNSSLNRYQEAQAIAAEQDKRAYREQLIAEYEEQRRRENEALSRYGGVGATLSNVPLLEGFGGFG